MFGFLDFLPCPLLFLLWRELAIRIPKFIERLKLLAFLESKPTLDLSQWLGFCPKMLVEEVWEIDDVSN